MDHAAFVAGLRAERESFEALRKILQSEQTFLVQSDVEGLIELTAHKWAQVEQLKTHEQQRARYLSALGLGEGESAMKAWLSKTSAAERPTVEALWRDLLNLAAEARSLNEINGKLITLRLAHNQAALSALHLSGRAQNVYGPDGQTPIAAGHRDLGRA
jgi:flagella synthesis protein FlgN